jgi:hypothetical protein
VPEYRQLSVLDQVPPQQQDGEPKYPENKQVTIQSSTRQANHHHVQAAGNCAAQPRNGVFERHKITKAQRDILSALKIDAPRASTS